MIPKFPKFTKLTFEHKPHLEKYILHHPPYSDFCFTSLICWGDEETAVSELNGNLVIKFKDYITDKPFYTFIGTNRVEQTITTLLEESTKNNLHQKLKLIPDVALKADDKILKKFDIQEDRDNFDYIYLLEDAKDFKGNKHRDKRNFINRFKKLYKTSHQLIDLASPKVQKEVLKLFHLWQKLKARTKQEVKNELLAIKRLISFAKGLDLICIGVYNDKNLIAFSINEVLINGYTMNLFEKADTDYQGIYPYLRNITAQYLIEKGGKFLSHEQDLGIEGLRKSKLSYNPHFFLKKYTISHKSPNHPQTK